MATDDSDARHACRHLLTKAMTITGGQAPADPDPLNAQVLDAGYAWCSRTLESVGPDERPVRPEECTAQRSCFERGPRL